DACLIVTSRPTSVAINSTSSSDSDCVAVFMTLRPMRILMMFCIGTPSACEKSRTLTPDSTETGPVGGAAGWRASRRGPSCCPPRAWRPSWRGRAAPVSMTTRRRRLPGPAPPRGRSGRLGLLPPLAICLLSVKPGELGIDPDGRAQGAGERALPQRPLEAAGAAAGVRAAAGLYGVRDQDAVPGGETHEL